MAERGVKVGLIGLGTIGTGVVRVLQEHGSRIDERLGFPLRLERIADIDLETDRGVSLDAYALTDDWQEVVSDPQIDLVIELIGGTGIARKVVCAALEAGKRVVTANKSLLASHGEEVYARAAKHGGDIASRPPWGAPFPCFERCVRAFARIESWPCTASSTAPAISC